MSKSVINKKYAEYRQQFYDFVKKDLEGPYLDEEVIEESPIQKYSTGILFPQATIDDTDDSSVDLRTRSDEDITAIDMSSSFFPSAMGMSFSVLTNVNEVKVVFRYGKYHKITAKDYDKVKVKASSLKDRIQGNTTFQKHFEYYDADDTITLKLPLEEIDRDILLSFVEEDNQSRNIIWNAYNLYRKGWYRENCSKEVMVELKQGHYMIPIENEHANLSITTKPTLHDNKFVCTLSLINTKSVSKPQAEPESVLFQVNLEVIVGANNDEGFQDLNNTNIDPEWFDDEEEQSLNLLYHNKKVYSVGHGVSADWDRSNEAVFKIFSSTLPKYSVPQMEFTLPESANKPNLSISKFAYGSLEETVESLTKLVYAYNEWIVGIRASLNMMPSSYQGIGNKHIESCKFAAQRILNGIELIKSDDSVFKAFRHANEAMLMQRSHTRLQSSKKHYDEAPSMPASYLQEQDIWRPFQIAFITMNLVSMSNHDSNERDIVDLIWFPTGGGKTEAYLGLTAFTIFYRRLMYPDTYGGTAVIMRYTLRLLTSQQFQRACTLICACEKLRQENPEYGKERITVGLWLGSASTPNNLDDAKFRIGELHRNSSNAENPFQVLNCPWCGTHMTKANGRGMFCYALASKPKRLYMWCPNKNCTFADLNDGLPILVIDDDIYNTPPTLLFGTVDKFAMLPWKRKASSIFAANEGNNNLSPSLIIQDELHLISGSLGTMVGIYEAAIDMLCSSKGIKPKIIASTATIRKAKDQCRSLYSRGVAQFPSPGIDASDSFFAREAQINEDFPGRMYVGVMPSGMTSTSMQRNLMGNTIQATKFIKSGDKLMDAYWTQVLYCNSIRELGTSKTLLNDDVQAYAKTVARYNSMHDQRFISDYSIKELTSRISAEKIPEILQQLERDNTTSDCIDVLLATNMISVGVDIDRLGLMIILGQPKTTSEYIQASSRVGRNYPGIVFTLSSPVKSRDRSHYEQFIKYHQSLYRHVEPTSVTPFSAPVRDKALHAVIFILIRHRMGLDTDESLNTFSQSDPRFAELINNLLKRVSIIDEAEKAETEQEIHRITDRLAELIRISDGITYAQTKDKDKVVLMKPAQDIKDKGEFRTPQSMRSTDSECYVTMDYS